VTGKSTLERLDRTRRVVDEVTLVRSPLQQLGSQGLGFALGELQGERVLRRRLAMSAVLGGAGGSRRGKPEDRVTISRGLGMMREPCQVELATGRRGEGTEREAVQREPVVRRQLLLHRQAGELMAEPHTRLPGGEHPRGKDLVQAFQAAGREPLEEPQLRLARHNGGRFQDVPPTIAETRKSRHDRVAHRRRDLLAAGRQHLRDEERISPRCPIQLGRVEV
jgi:hypothetical protein